MVTLMRRAGGFSPEEQLDKIYENLRAEYKIYVHRNSITTLADLRKRAAEFEDIKKQRETEDEENTINRTIASNSTYKREEFCWKCKQRGHTRATCQRSARKFCSQYGKDGVLTRDCHPRPGNDARAGEPRNIPRPAPTSALTTDRDLS